MNQLLLNQMIVFLNRLSRLGKIGVVFLVSNKTSVINQARAFLLEYGLTISAGAAYFVRDMPSMLSDDQNGLNRPGFVGDRRVWRYAA